MANFDKMSAVYLMSLLLFAITCTANTICPLDCSCVPLNSSDVTSKLHAKCNSLSGFSESLRFDRIQSIDCSGIGLETINNQFAQFTKLIIIDVSHNNLTRVPRLGRFVRTLDLSHNLIVSEKLHHIPSSVQTVNLAHNHLTEVPNRLLQLDHLERLDLTGNPIKCNCDTLHARIWLNSKRVKTTMVCSGPATTKGLSWDEVNMSDVCDSPKDEIWDIESNLMLNDQAVIEDKSVENPSEDEFGKDYLPFEQRVFKRQLDTQDTDDSEEGSGLDAIDNDFAGSGDTEITSVSFAQNRISLETTTATDEEGSGSDIAPISLSTNNTDIDSISTTTDPYEDDVILKPHTLGIFKETETTTIPSTTEEDVLLARISNSHSSAPVKIAPQATEANTETSDSTYVLLVILGLLLVGLIAFVVIRNKTANARRAADAENANGKEMLVMSKERLGKPINGNNGNNNGGEIIPLIGERDKWNPSKASEHQITRPDLDELQKAQEPLLKKIEEPIHTEPETTKFTNQSRPTSVASNHTPFENNNNSELSPKTESPDIHINIDPAPESTYAPISPKPARYSPVYSPETGRVKIKLTETPKPRTPMLVNRTRSNAGDLITTPLRKPE